MKKERATAKKIKELRARTGLSQVKFAQHFNIPLCTVTNWEQSLTAPPAYVVAMIERLVDLDF